MNPIQHFVTTDPLFRYVPNKPAAIEVLQATHRSPDTGHILDRIETLFNKGPMTIRDPLFLKEQFDALIVLAHIAKKITITQLGTAFYWRSALRHYGPENLTEVPLVVDGLPHSHAFSLLETTLTDKTPRIASIWNSCQTLVEEILSLPVSEQTFLYTPLPKKADALSQNVTSKQPLFPPALNALLANENEEETPLVTDITRGLHLNLFNVISIGGCPHRMFPSTSLVKTFCRHLFPTEEEATAMALRFGMSPSLAENGRRGERDVSLQTRFADLPSRADQFWAPHEAFTSHDLLYHFPLVSHIPKDHQKIFSRLSSLVKEGDPYLASLLEDLDTPYYLSKKRPHISLINTVAHFSYLSAIPVSNRIYSKAEAVRNNQPLPSSEPLLVETASTTIASVFSVFKFLLQAAYRDTSIAEGVIPVLDACDPVNFIRPDPTIPTRAKSFRPLTQIYY